MAAYSKQRLLNWLRYSPVVIRLILINVAVFVLLHLVAIASNFSGGNDWHNTLTHWLSMPASPSLLLKQPWSVLTYMFTQFDVMHIFFNMIWLYWFGTLFLEVGSRRQLPILYLLGGLGGAVVFALVSNLVPALHSQGSWLLGSSASVMAIVVATSMRIPNYRVHLILIGPVALKWIAIATIVIDCISMSGGNLGGHIAHLGGAIVGVIYATLPRRSFRWRPQIVSFGQRKHTPHRSPATSKRASASASDTNKLDIILDKIKRSGYTSLTPEERKTLFEVSNRIK